MALRIEWQRPTRTPVPIGVAALVAPTQTVGLLVSLFGVFALAEAPQ